VARSRGESRSDPGSDNRVFEGGDEGIDLVESPSLSISGPRSSGTAEFSNMYFDNIATFAFWVSLELEGSQSG
jgi:hypothetical protein